VNLVPWFPEIAVLAGALALLPALVGLRQATQRPVPATYLEPVVLALIGMVVLDGLVSARTGASFALGAISGAAVAWVADFSIEPRRLALFAGGVVLVGLGLVFELFGVAAGLDDGGWHLFGQLVAAFALGSALITALRPSTPTADASDAATFGAAATLVIASASPLVANRVDGAALPMLVLVAALVPLVLAFAGKRSGSVSTAVSAAAVAVVAAVVAAGLDPVALTLREAPIPSWGPTAAILGGIALGAVAVVVRDKRWALAVLVVSLVPFHVLGPYGTALGGLAAMAGTGLLHRPSVATTFLGAIALLAASHSQSPLATPAHLAGWVSVAVTLLVVAGIGALGKGSRLTLVRVLFLMWVVFAPFMSR